jgi:hypothetical protein
MISIEAIEKILDIKGPTPITPEEMVRQMKVCFFPEIGRGVTNDILSFSERLRQTLEKLGVKIVDYNSSLEKVPITKRVSRILKILANNIRYIILKTLRVQGEFYYIDIKSLRRVIRSHRLKKGVSVIVLGELNPEVLPMQYISSFKHNSIIHILSFPKNIIPGSTFEEHFDTAMSLFAYHMANIVLAVDSSKWMMYNFNASHPIYNIDDPDFEQRILKALIPKVVAPISPNRLNEFDILSKKFSVTDPIIDEAISDMTKGANLLEQVKIFPTGKKIDELPFRDNFHKLIGKLHLDNRSGMSFGFISKQLPITPEKILTIEETKKHYSQYIMPGKDYFIDADCNIHLIFELPNMGTFSMKVPEVWVLTLRSGSNKTKFNKHKDTLLLGLSSKGKMLMQFPEHTSVSSDIKPSFDTKVILAHATGNAIITSILLFLNRESNFANLATSSGLGISHWHGYFKSEFIPENCMVYGNSNLHVACSSPQSAIYALGGKLTAFQNKLGSKDHVHDGDIHIEPHHGINISYESLEKLGEYLINNPNATKLGNIYLKDA